MEQRKQPKQRNAKIEALRLLACLMVIMMHVRPALLLDSGVPVDGALLMQTLAAPGVGLFFMIAGCFMPQWPVAKSLKRFLFRIALPALLLVVLVNVLEGWLSGQTDLFNSLMQADLLELLRRLTLGILAFDANLFGVGAAHLWFVFSYAIILLWMPLLHVLVKADAKKALAFFAVLSLLRLVIIDLNKLWPFPVTVYLPVLPPNELLYASAGYLLFQRQKQLERSVPGQCCSGRKALLHLLMAGLLLCSLFFAQRQLFAREVASGAEPAVIRLTPYYLNWLSGFSALTAILIAAAFLNLPHSGGRLGRRAKQLICDLASVTYPVFLIHFPLIYKLQTAGVEAFVKSRFAMFGKAAVPIYTLFYSLFVFALSACVWKLMDLVRGLGLRLFLWKTEKESTS